MNKESLMVTVKVFRNCKMTTSTILHLYRIYLLITGSTYYLWAGTENICSIKIDDIRGGQRKETCSRHVPHKYICLIVKDPPICDSKSDMSSAKTSMDFCILDVLKPIYMLWIQWALLTYRTAFNMRFYRFYMPWYQNLGDLKFPSCNMPMLPSHTLFSID